MTDTEMLATVALLWWLWRDDSANPACSCEPRSRPAASATVDAEFSIADSSADELPEGYKADDRGYVIESDVGMSLDAYSIELGFAARG